MRRKTLVRAGIVVATLAGLLVVVYFLLRYEPDFYRSRLIPESDLRSKQAATCEGALFALGAGLSDKDEFQVSITEAEINSYLQDRFIKSNVQNTVLPRGVTDPRIAIDGDLIRMGFRYGQSPWSTIISVDFKVWRAPKETNVIALQLIGLRAGLIPLSSKFLMDKVADLVQGQSNDIEVSWYRHDGYLVALLRLGASKQREHPLEQLHVSEGRIVIASHATSTAPPRSEPPVPPPTKP